MTVNYVFIGLYFNERAVKRYVFFVKELALLPYLVPAATEKVFLDVDRDVIKSGAAPFGFV